MVIYPIEKDVPYQPQIDDLLIHNGDVYQVTENFKYHPFFLANSEETE